MDGLLSETLSHIEQHPLSVEADDGHSYHDLLSLRRRLMLLAAHSPLPIDSPHYKRILRAIAAKEVVYFDNHRKAYPIFNIHPPRSAGTFVCSWFRTEGRKQQTSTAAQR